MRPILTSLAMSSLAIGSAVAADDDATPNPYAKPDESWIAISGTVAAPDADSFILDYGDGVVTVEMDDWDWYGDAYGLLEGDKVTVYGEIDDDLYEITSIEAGSVYVENLNSWFYADSDDEEGALAFTVPEVTTVVISAGNVRGTVTSVNEAAEEFTIDTGNQQLTVGTDDMSYNPLDDTGYQQIEVGDRVSVYGAIEHDFFDDREFDADTVVTLSNGRS